jgi:hypothetical protein
MIQEVFMSISIEDTNVLRTLGEQYIEIAGLTVHKEKTKLWKALNRGQMERPMVCIDQLPWNELNQNDELTCKVIDPFWRKVELDLRKTIYKWNHFPVDMVIEPYITIPKVIENTNFGIRADVEKIELTKGTTAASQHFTRLLKDFDDLDKIKDMQITVDKNLSDFYYNEASQIFNGIAPFMQSHGIQFHLGIWDKLSQYIGMEDVYYELLDNPDFIHASMDRLTESTIQGIKQANELQIHNDISNTCHCSYVYTDELLPSYGKGLGALSKNSWGMGLAQLFTAASPQSFEEFELPYITRMAEHFGMIYYGCCERLDDRLDIVKKIPNVKKVSCSPWSKRKEFAEKIGNELIMSNKPIPTFIAMETVDWDEVRSDLKLTADLANSNKVNLEYILKDISTVRCQPDRLTKWADIAMELVEGV